MDYDYIQMNWSTWIWINHKMDISHKNWMFYIFFVHSTMIWIFKQFRSQSMIHCVTYFRDKDLKTEHFLTFEQLQLKAFYGESFCWRIMIGNIFGVIKMLLFYASTKKTWKRTKKEGTHWNVVRRKHNHWHYS